MREALAIFPKSELELKPKLGIFLSVTLTRKQKLLFEYADAACMGRADAGALLANLRKHKIKDREIAEALFNKGNNVLGKLFLTKGRLESVKRCFDEACDYDKSIGAKLPEILIEAGGNHETINGTCMDRCFDMAFEYAKQYLRYNDTIKIAERMRYNDTIKIAERIRKKRIDHEHDVWIIILRENFEFSVSDRNHEKRLQDITVRHRNSLEGLQT